MAQHPLSTPATFPTETDLTDIQGDVVLGLRKRFQDFIFFTISDVNQFKTGLKQLIPVITTTKDIQNLDKQIKEHKATHSDGSLIKTTGINIAFTSDGLKKLGVTESIGDQQFHDGQFKSAQGLGDPGTTDANKHFTPSWITAFKETIHGVFLVAGDSKASVQEGVDKVRHAVGRSIKEVFHVEANVRPGSETGHEHFGFLDGVSVPGIEGLTEIFPGQQVVKPGVLILGQLGDDNASKRPKWAHNGSILVYRHLAQLVPEFQKFLHDNPIPIDGLPRDKGSELLGARLVGRWKSGAPIQLFPDADKPGIGENPKENNRFDYSETPFDDQTNCPFSAHIRKTNPRTDLTKRFGPDSVAKHSIMRSGIPFGPEVTPQELHDGKTHKDQHGEIPRGLAFVCYQSVLANGFEFVQKLWANATNFPPKKDHVTGKEIDAGFDPIIGQNGNETRTTAGTNPKDPSASIKLPIDFVVSRGGAYFFSPSLTALKGELTATH